METLRICALAGSLRQGSYNRGLLRAAAELAPPGMHIEPFERLHEIPPFNQDVESLGDPEPVIALKNAIRSADGILIATPEYNYGPPGVLKNAIDWVSRPPASSVLIAKPIGLLGASPGNAGTARAQLSLRQSFVFTQSIVLPHPEILVNQAMRKFDSEGNLTDETTRKYLMRFLHSYADWVSRFHEPRIEKAASA